MPIETTHNKLHNERTQSSELALRKPKHFLITDKSWSAQVSIAGLWDPSRIMFITCIKSILLSADLMCSEQTNCAIMPEENAHEFTKVLVQRLQMSRIILRIFHYTENTLNFKL
jgi:hypothetical protein